MTRCPQGCRHPALGQDTMQETVEVERLDHPDVITGPYGEPIVREEIEHRFLECRVCGWVIDI